MTRVHLWDSTRCFNCGACIVACTMTNYPQLAYAGGEIARALATNISRVETETATSTRLLLTQCQQCSAAPCLVKCPAKAISREASGLLRTDERKCIKCEQCVANCPYGARWTNPQTRVPQSCLGAGCRALVASGQAPACVQACPASARLFGDDSEVAKRVQQPGYRRMPLDKGTKPNFYVLEKA